MIDLIGQKLGDYQIVEKIGEGGMANVYRATQQSVKRDVAVKVIQPSLRQNTDFTSKFEREAQTIASLSHPHIIKVFGYGVLRGFHLKLIDPSFDSRTDMVYFVLELQTGGALADLTRSGPLPFGTVNGFLTDIASALDYAHQKGVIHCDLKPENVLLDENFNTFLTDFGIAQLMNEVKVASEDPELIAGTPYYMAPEQWNGQPTGIYTDVYELGVILFEMLTGQVPFQGDTPLQLMTLHCTAPVPNVRLLRPEVPELVQRVIERAMAKDPALRYTSAGQLAANFEAALGKLGATLVAPGGRSTQMTAAVPAGAALPGSSRPATALPKGPLILSFVLGALLSFILLGLLILVAAPRVTPVNALLGNLGYEQVNVESAVSTLAAATQSHAAVQATNAIVISTLQGGSDLGATIDARVRQATPVP